MAILSRQVVLDTIKSLVVAMLALTVLLSVFLAAREALRLGTPALVVVRAMPCILLESVGYALPASVLFAVCSVFGRLSSDQELTALRSLGVSPLRLVEPVLAIAFLASLASVVSYDLTARWSRPEMRRLLVESAADVALGVLRTQRSIAMPWGTITVSRVEGGALLQPCVRLRPRAGKPEMLLIAERGELSSGPRGMRLVLHELRGQIGGRVVVHYPGPMPAPLPRESRETPLHRDWLAMRDVPVRLAALEKQLADPEFLRTASDRHRDYLRWRADQIEAEPHRRWANGFSCLAFALLGIPVAILRRNSDAVTTFFVAFFPILLVFYPLLMVSENLAIKSGLPAWTFWMADAVLACAGLVLLRRAWFR